jgi:hypothetical protein
MAARKTYWSTTIVLAVVLFTGGIADLIRVSATAEGVYQLGYPPIFLTILGTWKILGAVALLAPRYPRLKEWAYAGCFFNFSGAVISHIVAGSAVSHVVITAALAAVTVASWATRPADRTLGVLVVAGRTTDPVTSSPRTSVKPDALPSPRNPVLDRTHRTNA